MERVSSCQVNHYPRNIGDYVKDTLALSMEQDGAYTRLMDQYYAGEKPLPLARTELYGIARCTKRSERKAVDFVLTKYFSETPDGWRQKRCDVELEEMVAKSTSASRSAKARWSERNANGSAIAMRTQCDGNARQEPRTKNQEPKARNQEPASDSSNPLPTSKPRPAGSEKTPTPAAAETWEAYRSAYQERYHVDPVRNKSVNSRLALFVSKIGAREAPQVAVFFVRHNRGLYVSSKHATDLLLRDAEGLRTEWATDNPMTDTQARQQDRRAATGNVFGKLIAEADAKHGQE